LLLIVMYEAQTWRLRPGQAFMFGRLLTVSPALPEGDTGLSRRAGSFSYHHDSWWVHNDSGSSMLYLSGDLGFRVDLPPGMKAPLEQWHIKVRLHGVLGDYTLRLRLPDLDDAPDVPGGDGPAAEADACAPGAAGPQTQPAKRRRSSRSIVTSTHNRPSLNDADLLVLAARFEEYLAWRHVGAPAPRSAAETAERIGWQSHTVAKRCENIRLRYTRLGAPGLRGPRALEELARLLISTGALTADDLRRLPPRAGPG
jgi:hypothetical protein